MIRTGAPLGGVKGERSTDPVHIVLVPNSGGGSDRGTGETAETTEEPSGVSGAEKNDRETLWELMTANDRIGTGAPEESESSAEPEGPNVTFRTLPKAGTTVGNHSRGGKGTTSGKGTGDGEGDGQTVGFAGLEGKGRRFVYVIDRSESMRWPNDQPIHYALKEAKASVASLDPEQGARKFQVITYNQDATPFGNGRLMDVNAKNRERVLDYLDQVVADGGTDPLAALEMAIRLAPDVIFFLTDADEEISPMVLARIRELRIRGRVGQIHVMEFGKPSAKRLHSFQKLAEQNNGNYIFKDMTALSP